MKPHVQMTDQELLIVSNEMGAKLDNSVGERYIQLGLELGHLAFEARCRVLEKAALEAAVLVVGNEVAR
jgi:hypothetical protein